ncbi:MAG: PLP-dependent aminotransferase family protein [Deltaproteobacteria bacterium]|nr:PLP-dependent aminotransferase family protein [Deltaproteobacteria bacterium]
MEQREHAGSHGSSRGEGLRGRGRQRRGRSAYRGASRYFGGSESANTTSFGDTNCREADPMLLRLDGDSPTPAYRQICELVVALIDGGGLRPGDRLPATRRLATSVGVHRSTVVRAYEELRALGYVESTSGAYTTVRRRQPLSTASPSPSALRTSAVDWSRLSTRRARAVRELGLWVASADSRVIDFDRLTADPSLAPSDDLRRCLRGAVAREGRAAFDYTDPAGWRPLREALALRLRRHGVEASADQILITCGAQQGLDLVLRMLVGDRDRVAVEAPTYGVAHALLRLHGARPVEIPMQPSGMDLDALERALRRDAPKLVYTMPTFHNPTGTTTDQAHRERLLAICERARVPLLEDGFEEEMKYFGKAVLPIKSMDRSGVVLYVGTFSKVVFPGLRVGWIVAPREAIVTLTALQHASSLAVNTVAQVAAERFCRGGDFDAHLRRIHRVYRNRMQVLLRCLDEHLPHEIERTRPTGGYSMWLTLPPSIRGESTWLERIAAAGVRVAPGSRFFRKEPKRVHFRLSIACVDEAQIADGCDRLSRTLARALRS